MYLMSHVVERKSDLDVKAVFSPLGLDERSRVLIIGLGKTGISVTRFLSGLDVKVAVVDSRAAPPELGTLRELLPDVAVFTGGFSSHAFLAATHLVVSPGVSLDIPEIKAALMRGAKLVSDVDLFACAARAPVIAISGANGKSTVTSLVGLMAQTDGRTAAVGGNLGTPALDLLKDDIQIYILELSSFQTERTRLLEPVAATVLNISPDHLDRYAGLEAYAEAKRRIFHGSGVMVLNRDDDYVAAMARPDRDCRWFSTRPGSQADYRLEMIDGAEWLLACGEPLLRSSDVRIKGRHNLANALAAVALGDAFGLSRSAMVRALMQFSGLDHRMQWVAERGGVTWINDSKATNIGACIAALEGLQGVAVLIAGGDGKGADFSLLAPVAEKKLRAAILMGRDAGLLEEHLGRVVKTVRVDNMKQAVAAARTLAQPGDTVLLAPACASLDQYKDYQERGRIFVEQVRAQVL
jgi:UDP-N-acetylmuramoylalanine--D-glutamate ligase